MKLIEQIGAQPPDHACRAPGADDQDRDPEMGEDRLRLGPAHRLAEILLVHEMADGRAEPDIGEIHQDQRQHEVRNGKAEKAEESQAVVAPAVLMRGGVHADRKGHEPGEDDRDEGNQHGQPHSVPDDIANR